MDIFLAAFADIPDPRADNARHDLCELLVVGFVAVLCGATSCAEMADFGRAKEHVFRDFLKLRHSIPSHDTFSTVFRMIDPKALDAAFGRVLAQIALLLGDGDVIALDGKALRGARDKGQSAGQSAGQGARTRMMVSACAARLRLTLATVAADDGGELEAALEVLGLIALKGKVVTADALHCNRRTVAAIRQGGGDCCLALKANQVSSCPMQGPVSARVFQTIRSPVSRRPGVVATRPAPEGSFPPRDWQNTTNSPACRPSAASRRAGKPTERCKPRSATTPCHGCLDPRSSSRHPAPIGGSRMPCTGNLTCRFVRTPRATARITAPPTSPSCAAAPSTSPDATPPGGRSRSN